MYTLTRISTASNGTQGNSSSYNASISADGRYVVFESDASNLTPGDTNSYQDIFVKDLQTGTLTRVSTDSNGTQGNSSSYNASISADGRYVVFESGASNLTPGDTNSYQDIFVKDLQTGTLTRISTASNGMQGDLASYKPSISADGRYVAFNSWASNLLPGDTNYAPDVFVKDLQTGTLRVVSSASDAVQNLGGGIISFFPAISADGRYVTFESGANNLVPGDTNFLDVFVKDLQTGILTLVSTDSNGMQGNGSNKDASISADGRYVVFESGARNLVPEDMNIQTDVFIKDLQTGTVNMISTASNGTQGNNASYNASISADGRYVVFNSAASNLVPGGGGDTDNTTDVFVKDLQTGTLTRVSTDSYGIYGGFPSYNDSISTDGRYVVFHSNASNLVPGDTNNTFDIFLAEMGVSEIDTPNVTNTGIKPITDNIIVAALYLSARAYSDEHLKLNINKVNEKIQGWNALKAEDLGFSKNESMFNKNIELNGNLLRYDYKNASATVGLTILDGKRTLGISFEGTNGFLTKDMLQDITNIQSYYDSLDDFTKAVANYINANNIEQVLVTGHSLGGAAAQSFMHNYGQQDARFIGVTFGSPGTIPFQPVPEDRFVNIQHDGDLVVNAALAGAYIVSGSIVKAVVEDPGIDSLTQEHNLLTPLDGPQASSYQKTVEFITSKLDANLLFRDLTIGTDDSDVMTGGLLSNETFIGFRGNDSIDGGWGIDTAIYTAPRSSYVLTKLDQKFSLADQQTGSNNNGTDTLESIERIIFTDSALALDVDASAGMVAKLIGAVFGAGSISNTNYVGIGLSYLDNGTSYEDLAALAIGAAGANSPQQVTSLLWNNVAGSAPSADQIQPYIDMLNAGTTIGMLGILAADTSINQANVDLVGLKDRGIIYDPLDSFG